jgi:transcriptional regulator with XRE-family HTH domain
MPTQQTATGQSTPVQSPDIGTRPGAAPFPPGRITARLRLLFATVRLPHREYTPEEVAQWVTAEGGRLSRGYAYKLRSGEAERPSPVVIEWIARFFAVPASVLVDDDPPELDAALLCAQVAIRQESARAVMTRFLQLPPRARAAVADIIAAVLAGEQRASTRPVPSPPIEAPSSLDPALHDEQVRGVLMDVVQLPPERQQVVADIIDSLSAAGPTA